MTMKSIADAQRMLREPVLVSVFSLRQLMLADAHSHVSITATKDGGQVKNQIGKALVERVVRAARAREPFKVHPHSL